jgi:Uma2 family endonuclease
MTKLLDEPAPAAPQSVKSAAIVLNLRPVVDLTDDQFYELCRANSDLRFERTAQGEILIMAPTGSRTGQRNAKLIQRTSNWAEQDGRGIVFDSSTAFKLPNGATRSPDASWIKRECWEALSDAEQEKFSPICPDFVCELRSRTDSLAELQEKMAEYIANGAQLGWLIDPLERRVYVYRPRVEVASLDDPETVSGDPELPGFVLHLREIW